MAKIPLTQENVESLNRAFLVYFENDRATDREFAAGNLKWESLSDFIEDVSDTSGIDAEANYKSAKVAVDTINNIFTESSKAEKDKLESERPTTEQLETMEAEDEIAKAKYQETIDNAKKNVEAAIKRQQELHDKFAAQQKKIYAKVEQGRAPQTDTTKQQYLDGLKVQAKTDPKQLTRDIAAQVRAQISPSLSGQLSDEDINFIAEKTALDTVRGLSNPQARFEQNVQTAILYKLGADTGTVPKIIGEDSVGTFQQAANELAFFNNATEISRGYMISVDKDLAFEAFGDPSTISVDFYDTPVRGFTNTVSPDQLSSGYTNLLQNQSAFFSNLEGLGQGEAKSFLMGQARSWLDGQVSRMSPKIAGVYNNAFVQDALRFVGFGKPVAFGETGFGGVLLKIPGASSFFEGAGNVLGIDFIGGAGGGTGTAAATTVATEAATTIGAEAITTGVGVAAGEAAGVAVGAGAGAATGAATGAAVGQTAIPIPGVGAIIGAVVGFVTGVVLPGVLSWLTDKYNKNKEMVVAIPVAGLVTLFWGPLAGIASGVGSFGLMSVAGGSPLVTGGLSRVFSTISSAFSFIWSTFLSAVGPIIVAILIGVPILVTFILVIINNSAYVVPPNISSLTKQNEFIDITKTANPPGPFQNTDLPLKISYTITISARKSAITIVSIEDECVVINDSGSRDCDAPSITVPGGAIGVGSPFSFTYDANYDSSYSDSFVINTITVTANVAGKEDSQVVEAINSIKIGEPPEECPGEWPTGSGHISQGAYTTSTHRTLEALDIGVSHVGVMTTHSGVVVHAQSDSCYGNNIKIKSTCGGKEFVSRYAHLEGIKVKVGQTVTMGQQIGLSGNTTGGKPSCSTGAHLHYDFHYWPGSTSTKYPNSPPFMMPPYIPQPVKRGCVDNCFVSW